jgi:hypothetical protein
VASPHCFLWLRLYYIFFSRLRDGYNAILALYEYTFMSVLRLSAFAYCSLHFPCFSFPFFCLFPMSHISFVMDCIEERHGCKKQPCTVIPPVPFPVFFFPYVVDFVCIWLAFGCVFGTLIGRGHKNWNGLGQQQTYFSFVSNGRNTDQKLAKKISETRLAGMAPTLGPTEPLMICIFFSFLHLSRPHWPAFVVPP